MIKVFKFHSIKELTLFSIPIILGQLGIMLISAGDMYVASSHSTLSVGAIGVATGFFNPIFLFGVGLMSGISPALAIKRGEGEEVEKQLLNAILFATIAGFLLTFLTLGFNFCIPYLGIDKEMLEYVQRYISVVAWSFPFAYIAQAIKEFLQSFEDVFFANFISIVALIVVVVSLVFKKRYLFYILFGSVLVFITYLVFSQDDLKITGIEEHIYYFESGSYAIEDTATNVYSIYNIDSVKVKEGTFGMRGEFFIENVTKTIKLCL